VAVNGDLWTDYPFARLRAVKCDCAHLVLVPNPPHHPHGDFALAGARVRNSGTPRHTFSGIAVYHPGLFAQLDPGRFPLAPLLRRAVDERIVTGELFRGTWCDAGDPARLRALRHSADAQSTGRA